jgi:hypothetical protein
MEKLLEKVDLLLGFLFRLFLGFLFSISIIETDFLLRKTILFGFVSLSSETDCFRFREIDFGSVFISDCIRDLDIGSSGLI